MLALSKSDRYRLLVLLKKLVQPFDDARGVGYECLACLAISSTQIRLKHSKHCQLISFTRKLSNAPHEEA